MPSKMVCGQCGSKRIKRDRGKWVCMECDTVVDNEVLIAGQKEVEKI